MTVKEGNGRKRPEEINQVLEKAKTEWEAAFDSISEGLAIVESDGTIRRVNRALAALLGRDVRGMAGLTCCDLFAHHRAHDRACPVLNYPEGKQGAFEIFFPDYRYYEDSVHPIMRAGRVQGMILTVRDATHEQLINQEKRHLTLQAEENSRKRHQADELAERLRDELARSERTASFGRLAATILPELNRAMHRIRDGLQAIGHELPDPGGAEDLLKVAGRCSAILSNLDLLQQEDEEESVRIFLSRLLPEVIREAAPQAGDTPVLFDDRSGAAAVVVGQRVQLKAVFGSLLAIALEAMKGRSGEVTISLTREGKMWRVVVADRGEGKASVATALPGDPLRSAAGDAVGLGLAVCQTMVGNHKGEIEVQSTPGAGTRISVLLPVEPLSRAVSS